MNSIHKTCLSWRCRASLLSVLTLFSPVLADGPKDNIPENVRRIPNLGIQLSEADQKTLREGTDELGKLIADLAKRKDARTPQLLPDVVVYHRAVADALEYQEFFSERDVDAARQLLAEGLERASKLLEGQSPWTRATGLVVRGYISKIDGSVQPYGLVIPSSYQPEATDKYRLDLWFHGRGETLSEVSFLQQRRTQSGPFTPPDTFVLHPYGRYCNAFKFAGEVDVLEALEHARAHYRIDADRISARGFSMGGAACWQFAVHYADRWFAANPGAGFSETPLFLDVFQKEKLQPTWYERKLWRMYDCPGYALNLFHCPTIAYSGELDTQKQAADVMQDALASQGISLLHVIGPQTKHAIHEDSKRIIEEKMAQLTQVGRDPMPQEVHFVTYTLKYNRMHWVSVDALATHWEKAQVDARFSDATTVDITTTNVNALTLSVPSGRAPLDLTAQPRIRIDGQQLDAPKPLSDRSWQCSLHRNAGKWTIGPLLEEGLRKRHELQGPIDDAFMDSFVFVRPTGKAAHELVQKWTESELTRAIEHWRRHFRGNARVKNDVDISDADIQNMNLVLFGDPSSNQVLHRIADKLPIQWSDSQLTVGPAKYDSTNHAPILIYPNPLNAQRYVVLNSSFTFREYAYLNNARQVPMLPDWAVIDLREPANSRYPGKVTDAGFFGEKWEWISHE